jgi:stage III sporulation protein AB
MLKAAGTIFLVVSGLLWGLDRAARLKKRAASLYDVLNALQVIKSRTQLSDDVFSDIIKSAATGPLKEMMSRMAQLMAGDRFLSPRQAAAAALKEFSLELCLTDSDCRAFLQVMEKIGWQGRSFQEKYFQLAEAEFRRRLNAANRDADRKAKLFSYGGICIAMLLAILLA